jgi:uncharacterized RDD family membrane protein YckC
MPPPPPPPGQGSTPPPPPPATPSQPSYGSPPPPPGAVATAPGYPPYGYAAAPIGGERAGFGIRLGSFLLDGLLYGLLSLVFIVPAIIVGFTAFDGCEFVTIGDNTSELSCPPGTPNGGVLAAAIAIGVLGYLVVAFIYVLALGKGQTWGCRIVGIKVIGETTGEPIGFGRALGRSLFAGFISAQILYLGYLWMLWDDKKQTWQDKVVNSIVVKV